MNCWKAIGSGMVSGALLAGSGCGDRVSVCVSEKQGPSITRHPDGWTTTSTGARSFHLFKVEREKPEQGPA